MCVRFLTWYTICCTIIFFSATHYCRNFSFFPFDFFFWLPENIPVVAVAAASASNSRGKTIFASSRKMWGKNAREKPLRRKSIKGFFFLRLLFHIHKFLHSPHRAHLLRCVIKFFSLFFLLLHPTISPNPCYTFFFFFLLLISFHTISTFVWLFLPYYVWLVGLTVVPQKNFISSHTHAEQPNERQ